MSKPELNDKEVTIRQLYTELNKLGSNGEWEKAKKVANRSKNSLQMQKIKLKLIDIFDFLCSSWASCNRRKGSSL